MRSYTRAALVSCICLVLYLLEEVGSEYFLPSELEICDGNDVRTYKKKFCPGSKLVFTENSTELNSDCICISGIWLVINRDCVPSIVTGKKNGCLNSTHIKALQYLGALAFADDFFVVFTKSKRELEFKLARPVKTEIVNGQVWIYNGNLSKAANNRDSYCASRRNRGLKKNVMARYSLRGKLTIQYECSSNFSVLVSPQTEYNVIDKGSSECKLNCNGIPQSNSASVTKSDEKMSEVYFPKPRYFPNKTLKRLGKIIVIPAKKPSSIKKKSNNKTKVKEEEDLKEKKVRFLIRSFRDRLARAVLSRAFDKETNLSVDAITSSSFTERNVTVMELKHPKLSFEIMKKIREIVFKACAKAVPKRYLDLAYENFLLVYKVRGSSLLETLKEDEASKMLQFLDDCHSTLRPVKMALGCNEPIMTGGNRTSGFGYGYDRRRHLTLDIPWKMIDLSIGICVSAFGPSYILYHRMEQAMEKLFTKELRTLWKRPPERELFYTRLYGPNWRYYLEKLNACADAAYTRNPKLSRFSRLRRPDEISTTLEGNNNQVGSISAAKYFIPEVNILKPIQIPLLVPPSSHPQDVKKGKVIIPSVNLACQPFGLMECYSQTL